MLQLAHAYEQAILAIRRLGLPSAAVEEQFRRMLFNVVARNQGDHVKNIAFLMDRRGGWRLAPAFDLIYAYNPDGAWTSRHQMTLNGRREDFLTEDLLEAAAHADLRPPKAKRILREVGAAVADWEQHAGLAGVSEAWMREIRPRLRLLLIP